MQTRLHDSGAIWPRAELLRWLNDGYRELLTASAAVRRFRPLDIPGRHTATLTYEWEDRYVSGTVRKMMRAGAAATSQTTALWEAEHLGLVTPSAQLVGITQEWERGFTTQTDRHYRFTLPKNHDRLVCLLFDDKRLTPVAVRELDEKDTQWWNQGGEPRWWSQGLGRVTSVEVYEIVTGYRQQYQLVDPDRGIPRGFSGTRTYGLLAEQRVPNAYAYTTSGDAEALTTAGTTFDPISAYCYTWEATHALAPAWNFTINYTMNIAALEHVTVHPWEFADLGYAPLPDDPASPGKRGMFLWERLDPQQNYESLTPGSSKPPALTGPGMRVTTGAALAGYFGTQRWEADHLDGVTLRTGAVVGCFPWEEAFGSGAIVLALGTCRHVTSPDRQYLPLAPPGHSSTFLGRALDWRSSTDSLLALEVIVPDVALTETDTPLWIPAPMQKYLRFYVLARAFSRVGEGHQTILADHYLRRFRRGVMLMQRFADTAHRDHVWQREEVPMATGRVVPRVSHPPEFEPVS